MTDLRRPQARDRLPFEGEAAAVVVVVILALNRGRTSLMTRLHVVAMLVVATIGSSRTPCAALSANETNPRATGRFRA
jgi:hypothetical protein